MIILSVRKVEIQDESIWRIEYQKGLARFSYDSRQVSWWEAAQDAISVFAIGGESIEYRVDSDGIIRSRTYYVELPPNNV
jgi:hypothetical protein